MTVQVTGQRDGVGNQRLVLKIFALCVVAYHLYAVQFGAPSVMLFRSAHVSMYVALIFLAYNAFLGREDGRIPWVDFGLAILAILPAAYIHLEHERLQDRYPYITALEPLDWAIGILMLILVVEACRRALGWTLPIMLAVFVLHAFFGPYFPGVLQQPAITPERFLDHSFMTTAGLYGSITGLSATYVLMFVMFGAVLDKARGGELFMHLSALLTGKMRGGPGKAAVISSGLFGSLSGSAVANVYATGSFTIPLMIRNGFNPRFAAAVEAVASSSGQLVPPIMGSAAFLIADFTSTPYVGVLSAALIPAILYLFAVFLMVHLEALRMGLAAMEPSLVQRAREEVLDYIHMLLPLAVIIYLLLERHSPFNAAYWAMLTTFVLAQLRSRTRMSVSDILDALEFGGRTIAPIAAALFIAGLIISTIELTGLGLRFTSLLLSISGGELTITLVLVMISCIIMGMGLPTAAAYTIVAIFAAPALIKLGVQPLAAHFFVFYYAILSAITPPIAVAAYAAASIAGGTSLQATGFTAMRLGAAAYLTPFVIVANPALLMIGDPLQIVLAAATAVVGIVSLAACVQGWLIGALTAIQRVLLGVSAVLLLLGSWETDLAGIGLLAGIAGWQKFRSPKKTEKSNRGAHAYDG